MHDLVEGTLADLHTLMGHPPRMRRGNTAFIKGQPNPAAGAGFTYQIGTAYWERILAVTFTLTTSGTPNNRSVTLAVVDADGTTIASMPAAGFVYLNTVIPFVADLTGQVPVPAAQSGASTNSVTSPGAGATIVTETNMPAGVYQIGWQVELTGTVAAPADTNNFGLFVGSVIQAISTNNGAVGTYPQPTLQLWVPNGGSVTVKAEGAATTGAVYSCQIVPTQVQTSPIRASLPDLVLKSGWSFQIQGTNFAAADQLSAITILTERYPSNWADGSLGSDTEAEVRHLIRAYEAGQWRP